MKYLLTLATLLAGWSANVMAQDVWSYQIVSANNQIRVTDTPPRDLTYPPPGMPMPIVMGNENRGVVLTQREAAARRSAPQLIIMLIPAQVAERRRTASFF